MDINMNIENFETISPLGQGTYARVFLVKHKSSQQLMAAKVMKKKFIQKKKAIPQILNEKNILSEIQHPFVMKLNCSFQNKHNLFLMLQYCPGGQLFRVLEKKGKLNQSQACFYAAQIALAIQYLHSKNIIYRDLKPENVVIDQKGYIKVTDFGLASYVQGEKTDSLGTPSYYAPQIAARKQHGFEVDWWCFGMIIYQMVVGEVAFQSSNKTVLMDKILNLQPAYPAIMSNKLKNLLQGLFKKNPLQRLGSKGINEIIQHPWFQKINFQYLLSKQIPAPIVPVLKSKVDISNFDAKFTSCMYEALQQQQQQSDTQDENQQQYFKGYECLKIELPVKKQKSRISKLSM